jgi:hypothetical protein
MNYTEHFPKSWAARTPILKASVSHNCQKTFILPYRKLADPSLRLLFGIYRRWLQDIGDFGMSDKEVDKPLERINTEVVEIWHKPPA